MLDCSLGRLFAIAMVPWTGAIACGSMLMMRCAHTLLLLQRLVSWSWIIEELSSLTSLQTCNHHEDD